MQSVEEWKKNKGRATSSKIQSVSDFLKNNPATEHAKNVATLAQREENIKQGVPVSIFKSRVEPNIVEKAVASVLRPFADVALQVENTARIALDKKEVTRSSNLLGEVKGLGKIDLTKSPWEKENLKTIIKSASTGAEIASYLNAAGVAEKTIAGLTAKGVLANKKLFAEWAVKNIPSLAKEGALQGLAYTAGSQGREYADTGKPFSAKQAVTDVALSTAGNVVIPTALRKVFGGDAKINAARLAEQKAKEVIPSPSTKVDDIVESGLTNKGVIDTPSQPGVENPLAQEARKYKSAEEFVKKESFNPNSKFEYHLSDNPNLVAGKNFSEQIKPQNIGERGFAGKEENIGQIFSTKNPQQWSVQLNYEGNAKPQYVYLVEVKNPAKVDIMDGLPHQSINSPADVRIIQKIGGQEVINNPSLMEKAKQSQLTDFYNKAIKETTPTQGTPIIKEVTPETVIKDTTSIKNDLPEGLDYGNFNTWSKEVRGIYGVDANEAINVAMGGQKKIKNEIPPNAYLSIMKNVAEETGDIKLAQKLANSNVASKSGQNLVASKMAQHGNVTDILRDVKVSFLKKKGVTPERFIAEEASLLTKVKQQFKEIDDAIISSLLCK